MAKSFKGLTSKQMIDALAKHPELFKKLATILIGALILLYKPTSEETRL